MSDKDHIVSFLINNAWYNLAHLPLNKDDALREAKNRGPSRVIKVTHDPDKRLITHTTVKEFLNR